MNLPWGANIWNDGSKPAYYQNTHNHASNVKILYTHIAGVLLEAKELLKPLCKADYQLTIIFNTNLFRIILSLPFYSQLLLI